MGTYPPVSIPFMAFYSRLLYRDVALNWRGTGFGYLLLLLAFCWIPIMVVFQAAFLNFAAYQAPAIVSQLPKITIVDGHVSVQAAQPCYIKDPETGQTMAVLDTTGQFESLDKLDSRILLTKTKLVVRDSPIETRAFNLSQVKNFAIDEDVAMEWLGVARTYLVLILYPLAVVGSCIYRIIQVLLYATIGMVFCSMQKAKLPYTALMRLAAMAITPSVIINMFMTLAGVVMPYAAVIYLAIAMGYLTFGIYAAAQPQAAPSERPSVE